MYYAYFRPPRSLGAELNIRHHGGISATLFGSGFD